jgi:tRNA(fMet)-specific endonuclease VapC
MSLPEVMLDTDILSALMRKNHQVVAKAKAYLAQHRRLTLSIITRYEILRGLKANAQADNRLTSNNSAPEAAFYP